MRRPANPTPAGLRRAISESVDAARAEDAERFGEAAGRLAVQDPQRLVLVRPGDPVRCWRSCIRTGCPPPMPKTRCGAA